LRISCCIEVDFRSKVINRCALVELWRLSRIMENNFKPKMGDNITIEYHGELMENFFSESTIDSGKGLRAVKYKDDLAILLFINKQHKLRLIIQIDDSASGWTSYDLSLDQIEVSAFDIHHDQARNILKIAYSRVNNGSNQLLVSDDIPLSGIEPLLFTQNLKWNQIKLNNTSRKIDHISINQSGLLFSTAYRNQDATYSYFRYGENPQDYTLPENSPDVIQLEVGQFDYDFGAFLLYEMRGERSMIFQSFPDKDSGEVTLHRFKPSNELCGFTTLDDKDGNDQLYLAGDGIFTFKMEEGESQPTKSTICESGRGIVFSEIEVSSHGNETTIWTIGKVNGKSGLYYLTNRFYESANQVNTSKWTTPLQMQEDIKEFSSIKGDRYINQLFLLGSDENANVLIHFWQDKATTSWYEHPVVLPDLEALKKLETFTVNVQFKSDAALLSFHGEKVSVSAEANLLVYIGGKKVAIGPNRSYETTIQDDYINIVYPTKSVAASLLYVEADFLPGKVTIDPAHKLKEAIKVNFGDKDKLKNAKRPDGKSLIDSSDVDQIVSATNTAYGHINSSDSGHGSVTPNAINFAVTQPTATALAQPQVRSVLSDIGNAFGDIWHAIKKGFIEVTDFISQKVQDGVKFIIKIGEEVFEWISKAVSDVFHFLERIWEKVNVFFKDVFEYIGFLFNWDDIIHTKRVMKQYLSNIILGLADELTNVRKKTYDYFDELKGKIEDLKKEIDFKQLNSRNLNELRTSNTKNDKIDPRANWMGTKKSYITNSESQQQVASGLSSDSISKLSTVFEKLTQHFEALGKQLTDAFSDLSSRFMDVVQGNMKIGDFLEYFVLTLAQIGIATAQEIIDLIFEILVEAIRSVDGVLNASINIPFFSYLYKEISGDDLSVSDLICLLIAIPMTVLYKVAEGEAPFKNENETKKFIDAGKMIFTLLPVLKEG
jgi:hypothetical protein